MTHIAVYGTLKRGFGNHHIIEWQKKVLDDFVEFEKISGNWFPRGKFNVGTNKFLRVEIYDVDEKAEKRCDQLEWIEYNFYRRKEVKTLSWLDVIIYEICADVWDESQKFFTHSDDTGKTFYDWR